MPDVGIVIPTLNESAYIGSLLDDLRDLRVGYDVMVADGGSTDETLDIVRSRGVRALTTDRGRGVQLNAGAREVRGEWLCFLHADVRVPGAAWRNLERLLQSDFAGAAVWRLNIAAEGVWFRVIEFGATIRDRVGGLPYGDQGLCVPRSLFSRVGGYPNIPLMEDVVIVRRLKAHSPVMRMTEALHVSARRWRRQGAVRTWLRNVGLMSAFMLGVPPERLARFYDTESR